MTRELSLELLRMPKKKVARLFVASLVAVAAGLVLALAALVTAVATDAIDFDGTYVIDVNGGPGAWIALVLVAVGSVVAVGGTVAAVVSWAAALVNTWQLEDKLWFASLLALGVLGLGVVAMVAYVVAGPDGTTATPPRGGIAETARSRAAAL